MWLTLMLCVVLDGYDIIQGSRYLKGGGVGGDMPFYRKIATRAHPFLFSLFTILTDKFVKQKGYFSEITEGTMALILPHYE